MIYLLFAIIVIIYYIQVITTYTLKIDRSTISNMNNLLYITV